MAQDIRVEMNFDRKMDSIGIIYYATSQIPVKYPDVLLFCLYSLGIMTHRKIPIATVSNIQTRLKAGEQWVKVFERADNRPFDPMMTIWKPTSAALSRRVIRTQVLFRDKNKYSFMFGSSGFGLLSLRKNFIICGEGSVYGLMEYIFREHEKEQEYINVLWKAAERLGAVDFSISGKIKERKALAKQIFDDACGVAD